jgi:hypothetical protein
MISRLCSVLLLAFVVVFAASCGAPSLMIGGVVYQSLDVEDPMLVVVGGDQSRRPPTDLGPLVNAQVAIIMKGAPNRVLQTTTDRNGQFSVTYPGKMFGSFEPFIISFRQKGFEAVRFIVPAEDLRRAYMESGERTFYMEYWVPFLEPGS